MTAPRKVALMEDEISEAAASYSRLPPTTGSEDYEVAAYVVGARFAREFYEQREAKWREWMEHKESIVIEEFNDDGECVECERFRAALGLEG